MLLDVKVLFAARVARLFSYGSLTVCLLLYLEALGLSQGEIGALLAAIFCGDIGITIALTTQADAVGRKRTLLASAVLKTFAGAVFGATSSLPLLAIAGIVGVISPAGGEIGPFLSVEQSALAEVTASAGTNKGDEAARLAAWYGAYNAVGYIALAAGALTSGWAVQAAQAAGWSDLDAYRLVLHAYAGFGCLKLVIYSLLSADVETQAWRASRGQYISSTGTAGASFETPPPATAPATDQAEGDPVEASADDEEENTGLIIATGAGAGGAPSAGVPVPPEPASRGPLPRAVAWAQSRIGIASPQSRATVARLSALFALDAFAGGLAMQSVLVRWFSVRWGMEAGLLGALLMGCNVFGGLSSIAAGHLVARIGAVNTMTFTHLPSNVLLALVPLMPTASTAVACLLLRFCLSQMDVPARQAYVASVVQPHERSAAAGVTNVVRSLGVALSPPVLALFTDGSPDPASLRYSGPFWVAAALKCIYDLTLYAMFSASTSPAAAASKAAATARGAASSTDRGAAELAVSPAAVCVDVASPDSVPGKVK